MRTAFLGTSARWTLRLPDPQLPAVTGARLVKAPQAAGFVLTRTRGSHHRLKYPDGRATTVPVHAGRDVPKGTLRGVLRDCGMSAEDLRQLLS
jgi:predicted RNA binding protein YcfA (HicA-like mRNA interferase family)